MAGHGIISSAHEDTDVHWVARPRAVPAGGTCRADVAARASARGLLGLLQRGVPGHAAAQHRHLPLQRRRLPLQLAHLHAPAAALTGACQRTSAGLVMEPRDWGGLVRCSREGAVQPGTPHKQRRELSSFPCGGGTAEGPAAARGAAAVDGLERGGMGRAPTPARSGTKPYPSSHHLFTCIWRHVTRPDLPSAAGVAEMGSHPAVSWAHAQLGNECSTVLT